MLIYLANELVQSSNPNLGLKIKQLEFKYKIITSILLCKINVIFFFFDNLQYKHHI